MKRNFTVRVRKPHSREFHWFKGTGCTVKHKNVLSIRTVNETITCDDVSVTKKTVADGRKSRKKSSKKSK